MAWARPMWDGDATRGPARRAAGVPVAGFSAEALGSASRSKFHSREVLSFQMGTQILEIYFSILGSGRISFSVKIHLVQEVGRTEQTEREKLIYLLHWHPFNVKYHPSDMKKGKGRISPPGKGILYQVLEKHLFWSCF